MFSFSRRKRETPRPTEWEGESIKELVAKKNQQQDFRGSDTPRNRVTERHASRCLRNSFRSNKSRHRSPRGSLAKATASPAMLGGKNIFVAVLLRKGEEKWTESQSGHGQSRIHPPFCSSAVFLCDLFVCQSLEVGSECTLVAGRNNIGHQLRCLLSLHVPARYALFARKPPLHGYRLHTRITPRRNNAEAFFER